MSRGEILDNKGGGLYTIKLKYAVAAVHEEIVELQAALSGLGVEVSEAELAVSDKTTEADQLERQIDILIPELKTDRQGTLPKIFELQQKLADVTAFIAYLRIRRD